jgi:hypothetical protein
MLKEEIGSESVPSIGDLTGAGQVINSEIAKRTYNEALSPAMKELGGLSEDTLKALRLFTAPLQLAAAYQDRFKAFCQRVRDKVPTSQQQEAPPEIVKPVMDAFASTSDDSPLMKMFEELMTKAIDKREANRLSPEFPAIIKSLSPLEALLITELRTIEQSTDDLRDTSKNIILQRIGANFDFEKFGGQDHHLSLTHNLKYKNLIVINDNEPFDAIGQYPTLRIPEGLALKRTTIRLTMFGRWFVSACVP